MKKNESKANKGCGVSCMDCANSCLYQYGNDPVLSACQAKPQPYNVRFPYEVEVARVKRSCSLYVKSNVEKVIEHRQRQAA